jgi:protein-tyrosine phosphatase
MRQVLFICSGNYYRSRFAEAVFNAAAHRRGVEWRAFSRGLATHLVASAGEISIYTRFALAARGIALHHTGAMPVQLSREDLERAQRVIALKEAEHRPLMKNLFPEWERRIEYWNVHDLDAATPESTVPGLERLTLQVLDDVLAAQEPVPAKPTGEAGNGERAP